MQISPCRLCHRSLHLCNSHILPEFVYKDVYDASHKYYEITGTADERNRRRRKGAREYLLCRDCEDRFQVHEDYAYKMLFSNNTVLSFPTGDGKAIITDINYESLKLFQLSILWRSSVTTNDMFRHVKLGPYEEPLRQILLRNDYVPPDAFPFSMAAALDRGTHVKAVIMEPIRRRIQVDNSSVYCFLFGGYYWVFHVSINKSMSRIFTPSLDIQRLEIDEIEITQVPGFTGLFVRATKQGKFKAFEEAEGDG